MKNHASTFFFVLSLLIAQPAVFAQQEKHTLPEDLVTEIESRIAGGHYVGLEIGILDSTGMHFYGFGKTSLKDGTLPDENTIFEIGSISKVFTGILLADRVGEGRMKLDDPIEDYLPEQVKVPERDGKKILLRQLSTHTSGLPRMPSNMNPKVPHDPFADYDAKLLYDFLSSYELRRDIGSQAEYSNLAVGMLGHIMSLEANQSYEELLVENICEPLGLASTRITLNEEQKTRLALPYSQGLANYTWDFDCLAACGAIRSSAADMLRFLAANADPESPLAEAMALSQQVHGEQKLGNAQMGLGWLLLERDGRKAIIHDGATGGYRAFAGLIPAENYAFVVLANSTTHVNDIGTVLLGREAPLQKMGPTLLSVLVNEIDQKGFKKGIKKLSKLKKSNDQGYFFSANSLNQVGTHYFEIDDFEMARKIFEKNTALYPKDANVLFALGEVAAKQNQPDQAEKYYRQCLDLKRSHVEAFQKLKDMGADMSDYEVVFEVTPQDLEAYTGVYQLAPGADITVTTKDKQLFAQVTGQADFEIYPSEKDEYYYKVVDAQISFNRDEKGAVKSLTLHQGGRDMEAKRK